MNDEEDKNTNIMTCQWFVKLVKPRFLKIIFSLLAINIIIYLMTSVNFFSNAPDGTSIDFSDAHRRELIEQYRKQQESRLPEKISNQKTQINENNLDDTDSFLRNKFWSANENNKKPQEGSSVNKDGATSMTDLDPDLADIFNDLEGGKKDDKVNQIDSDEGKSAQDADGSNDDKDLSFDYDEFGNVVVKAGALLDFHDKLSNVTKILPKETIPYKCWEGAFYTEPYLLSKELGPVDFECMDLRVSPATPICLYQSEEDVFISAYLRYNGLWEGHIVDQIQRALSKDEELGLIDLGANLGQYALIAAKMGRKVFAVEPYFQTLRRFQKAAQMGDLISNIRVLKNAITDVRTDMYIHLNPDNMGDARVNTNNSTCEKNCQLVRSILLSDIVPYLNFNKAILKIDIQGYENVIFYYANHLFDNVYIPYIFMEWVLLREFYVHKDHTSNEKRDVEYTIAYLTGRGYTAYSSITGKQLNLEYWGGWPEDVYWVLHTGDTKIFNLEAVSFHMLTPTRIRHDEDQMT